MEFDKLKSAWQESPAEDFPGRPDREIVNAVLARLESIRREIRRRDVREIAAALVGVVVFGIWFWTERTWAARLGCAIVVAGSVLIIVRLLLAHARNRRPRLHLQVREYCGSERDRLEAQIRLLRLVLWWYLAPLLLGCNLFVFGLVGWHAAAIAFLVISLILGAVLYRLNRRAVQTRLMPLKQELDLLVSELDRNGNRKADVLQP